jgi:hypothetical protein
MLFPSSDQLWLGLKICLEKSSNDEYTNLSRCAWECLELFLQETVPEKNSIPGAVIAIQTFGDSPSTSNRNR